MLMSKPVEVAVVEGLVEELNLVLEGLCAAGVRVKLAPMFPDDRQEVCVIVEGVRIEQKRLVLAGAREYSGGGERRNGR
jgi:hypothetical protein